MAVCPHLEQLPISQLFGKRIGYYPGSFDPLHAGHQAVISQLFEQKLVDYVILYPIPCDHRDKKRSDFVMRQLMLQSVYKLDPRVILTYLSPADIQNRLSPYFNQFEVLGILGSDNVKACLSDLDAVEKTRIFMRGEPIPQKHAMTTMGAAMALRASSFIIALRNSDDLSDLKLFAERPITAFLKLEQPVSQLTSTRVREEVKQGRPIGTMVAAPVNDLIQRRNLYRA